MKSIITLSKLAILLALIYLPLSAQIDSSLFNKYRPRNIGPAGMSGRITSISVVESNPDIIYAGAASGGVWKSENGGITWNPIFDKQPVQAIGSIAVCQSNPNIVWVGTGEGNPRNSQSSGNGIYLSLDAGKSWTHKGLKNSRNIHRIIIDQNNPNVVYAGVQGASWGAGEERGVFKSTDGGDKWEKILYINDRTGVAEMVTDPHNPLKIIVAMWEFKREAWFFTSGGEGSGIYITYDGGKNWKKLDKKDGLPAGKIGRSGLAFARNNSNVVYALIEAEKNALYRSNDGGENWYDVKSNNVGGRPFYYAEIYLDPTNENRVYNIHSVVDLSEDGGKTFTTLVPYRGVHPDHHAWWINPNNPNHIIDGNDGGLAISKDMGKNWRHILNIPVSQFYHINYDMDIPYNIYGGMQDNGSWAGPGYVWKYGGVRNSYWKEVMFGDGFDVVPDPDDSRYGYAMWQGGNLGRYDKLTGRSTFIKPSHPKGENLRFNWNAGIAVSPFDASTLYYGSQYVHKSTDKGVNWSIISPDLTTNDTTKQKQSESGGLTYDVTTAENHTTILCIAPSTLNQDIIWVGTDDGNLQLTKDGGLSWTNVVSNIKEVPANSWVPQIVPSTFRESEAFVVMNNYRRDDWNQYLMHTTDFGKTWKNIAKDKNIEGYCLSFVQDFEEEALMFLGTEFGLYYSIDKGQKWNKWNNEYPSVSTMDLKIHPRESDLIIGTFGRAAWIFDNIAPFRDLVKSKGKLPAKAIQASHNPDSYMVSLMQADGIRFAGNADFFGDNKSTWATINFWINPEKVDTSNKSLKNDSIKVSIYQNTSNENVRNLYFKVDKGYNTAYWAMDSKGFRLPYSGKSNDSRYEDGGGVLEPGEYRIEFEFAGEKDNGLIKIYADPRIELKYNYFETKRELYSQFEKITTPLTEIMDNARDIRKELDRFELFVKSQYDSKDTVFSQINEVRDSIKTLFEYFNGPEGKKGIFSVPNTLNDKISTLSYYISSSSENSGSNIEDGLVVLEKETIYFKAKYEDFRTKVWSKFRNTILEKNVEILKDF